MNMLSATIGFWSSFFSAMLFVIFILCFVAIAVFNPIFRWTNITDYSVYVHQYNQIFKNIAQTSMLFFGPLFVIMVSSIHDIAKDEQKILTRTAFAFAAIFAALIGLHYFVQISAVRVNIEKSHLDGLEHFLQSKPDSAISAINMLGWSLFLGLSSIFIAPIFSGNKLENALKRLFLLNGIFCFLGGIGYVFENVLTIFLAINFGMGGCVTAISVLLAIFFKRVNKTLLK